MKLLRTTDESESPEADDMSFQDDQETFISYLRSPTSNI